MYGFQKNHFISQSAVKTVRSHQRQLSEGTTSSIGWAKLIFMEAYCLLCALGRATFQVITMLQCSNRASIFTDGSEHFTDLYKWTFLYRWNISALYSHHQGQAGHHWPPPCSYSCCYSGTVKREKKTKHNEPTSVSNIWWYYIVSHLQWTPVCQAAHHTWSKLFTHSSLTPFLYVHEYILLLHHERHVRAPGQFKPG